LAIEVKNTAERMVGAVVAHFAGSAILSRCRGNKEVSMAARTEALIFWRYIASSLDRLVACLDGLDADGLNWRPAATEANSLYALTTHTLGNA
jgi:hypothetical protein